LILAEAPSRPAVKFVLAFFVKTYLFGVRTGIVIKKRFTNLAFFITGSDAHGIMVFFLFVNLLLRGVAVGINSRQPFLQGGEKKLDALAPHFYSFRRYIFRAMRNRICPIVIFQQGHDVLRRGALTLKSEVRAGMYPTSLEIVADFPIRAIAA